MQAKSISNCIIAYDADCNSCLNPVSNSNTNDNMISNGNCGGTVSQQGRSGQSSAPTTVQNANSTIEVQRSTTTTTPNPNLNATLLVDFACITGDGSSCPSFIQAHITITGNNPQPRTFVLTDEDIPQHITLGTGSYTVSVSAPSPADHIEFSGDCSALVENDPFATGIILAGQTQHCTVIGIENLGP